MGYRYHQKFRVKLDKLEGRWHIGLFFCVDFEDCNGNRDKYLMLSFGCYDLCIGLMSEAEEI